MRSDAISTGDPSASTDGLSSPVTVAGNRLTLLPDGPDARPALLELIEGAKTELHLIFYIYEPDRIGTEVRDALTAAAQRGVEVHLVLDGFGSAGVDDEFFKPMIDAGGDFCRFHPRFGRRYLLRNHQKMAIADRTRAIIGGFNIADNYFETGREDSFRDLGLIIDGPAADHLAAYFERLFHWIKSKRPTLRSLRRILSTLTQSHGPVRWIFGGPSRRISPYARQLRTDMKAGQRLRMMMAYFAPNPRWLRLFGNLARRGEATLITAGKKSDVPLARLAAWATYGSLLRRRVNIFEYRPRALHAKMIVIDDIVYLGSGNFDMRSLYLNLEVMLRVDDPSFAEHLRAMFDRELEGCQPISRELYHRAATWSNRLWWRLAYWLFVTADLALSRTLTHR
ncbi:phosphatidylserine/phosphatidylglycerophosphate/cardiolipin synthase family protein [Sphingoaurantiacus capsulatus]|uniref:Phospholipase D n=1 Tax=Sphingoaurantiacus capsulatus TaxID=1771310 RepID=A0ABV7X8A6_9SPHN